MKSIAAAPNGAGVLVDSESQKVIGVSNSKRVERDLANVTVEPFQFKRYSKVKVIATQLKSTNDILRFMNNMRDQDVIKSVDGGIDLDITKVDDNFRLIEKFEWNIYLNAKDDRLSEYPIIAYFKFDKRKGKDDGYNLELQFPFTSGLVSIIWDEIRTRS